MKIYQTKEMAELSMVQATVLPKEIGEFQIREELKKLIEQSTKDKEEPITIASNLVYLPEFPMDNEELLDQLMETEEFLQLLLLNRDSKVKLVTDEDLISSYEERTLYSYLIDLTNYYESRE